MQGPPLLHCWHCNCRALAVIVLDSIQRIHHCDHLTIIQVALAMQRWFLWKKGGWLSPGWWWNPVGSWERQGWHPLHSPLFILTQNCAHFTTCHNFYIEETVRVQKFVTNSNTKISRLQIRVTNTNTRHPHVSLSPPPRPRHPDCMWGQGCD